MDPEYTHNSGATGFQVYGTFTASNTSIAYSDGYNGANAYFTVNNGGKFNATGCSFNLQSVSICGTVFAEANSFPGQITLGADCRGTVKYNTFTYNGYNFFNAGMSATVAKNDFSTSKAESQGSGGPVILTGNYWGSTDPQTIRARIFDQQNNASLPAIDFSSPMSLGPCIH